MQGKDRGGDVTERREMRLIYGIATLLCLIMAIWAVWGQGTCCYYVNNLTPAQAGTMAMDVCDGRCEQGMPPVRCGARDVHWLSYHQAVTVICEDGYRTTIEWTPSEPGPVVPGP